MTSEADRLTPTRITDPKAVAAITHPLRMRLLGELSRRGAARAVDLAAAVGEPANSVSFHLRQLAKYGLVEDDPARAQNARERWWRQTSDRGFEIDLDAMRAREGGEHAVETVRRVAEGHVLAVHRTIHPGPGPGPGQRTGPGPGQGPDRAAARHTLSDDFALRLSDAELAQFRGEVQQLLDRWAEISRVGAAAAGDGRGEGETERHGYYGLIMAARESDIATTYASAKEHA